MRLPMITLLTASGCLGALACSNQPSSRTPDESLEMRPAAGELTSSEVETASEVESVAAGVIKVRRPKPFPMFGSWDENSDKMISQAEFEAGMDHSGVLDNWDNSDDGKLTAVEFEKAAFGAWDLNSDGAVDVYEHRDGSGAYFPAVDAHGTFDDYDLDRDNELTRIEFASLAARVFEDWDQDTDGFLNEKELQTALYEAWDLNDDGQVDEAEYRWE